MREKQTGRVLQCSKCGNGTCKGTTQVFRKIVFHFCVVCWIDRRLACNAFMEGVAA